VNGPAIDHRDLTTGHLPRAILRLALPATGMMYMNALFNIVDTIWVGRLGPEALAGVSTAGFVVWAIFSLIGIVSVGVQAIIARRIGEGDLPAAQEVAARGLVYALVGSIAVGVLLYPARAPLFALMQTSEAVTIVGNSYLTIMIHGISTLFLSFVITGIFQAAGDTATPTKLAAGSLALNAILDPVLIFGWWGVPAMGVAGAAWATVGSRLLFVVWGAALLRKGTRRFRMERLLPREFHWRTFGAVVRIGLPPSVAGILFAGVYMVLTRTVSDFGDQAIAALRIGHIVEFVNYCTGLGFATAAGTLIGQSMGAGRPDRAADAMARILALAAGIVGVVTVWFFAAPDWIVRIFSADPQVIAVGSRYLLILGVSQVFMVIEQTVSGGFSGAGDTMPPSLITIPLTLLRIPLAWGLAYSLGLGVEGVWWAISGTTILKGALIWLWWRTGRWRRRAV
jgi:putative MATE family efflux protein